MRRAVLSFVALGVAVLLAGGVALVFALGPASEVSQAQAQTSEKTNQEKTNQEDTDQKQAKKDEKSDAAQEEASKEKKSGVFNVRWGDPQPDEDGKPQGDPKVQYTLVDDQNEETELQLDEETAKPLGGPLALNGKGVDVEGTKASDDKLKVDKIQRNEQADADANALDPEALTGSRPNVTIACRFADSTNVTPRDTNYFHGLVGGDIEAPITEPSLDHYWRQVSYNNINLFGSGVRGWYNLPNNRSHYFNTDGSANLNLLFQECTAAADADVNFPSYTNINLMFNQNLDCCAWGGGRTLTADGQTRTYGTTWMPPWAFNNQDVLGHELGHSFGLPHSSGPYSATYDSQWDVMSAGGTCSPAHTTYGCLGVHTISYHKDRLQWIPASQKVDVSSGTQRNVTIDRLGTNSGTLMAKIPIGSSTTQFYTVEARKKTGYDNIGGIPLEGIVIHKVDTAAGGGGTSQGPAKVVDATNDNNPNDAGAQWLPNETFTDSANKISVKVTGSTTNGYTVQIQNNVGTPQVYQENDRVRTRYAGWTWNYQDSIFSGGYGAYNNRANSSTQFTFTGKTIWWRGLKGTDSGRTYVYLKPSGGSWQYQGVIDAYSATRHNAWVWGKSVPYGTYTVMLLNSGTKNASSSGTYTDLDAFVADQSSTSTPSWAYYQENDPRVAYGPYSNPWYGTSYYRYSNSSATPAAQFLSFKGPYVYANLWTGPQAGWYAKATVTDASSGQVVKTQYLPLYASTSAWRWLYIGGLDATKTYNLELSAYNGKYVYIDAYYGASAISGSSAAAAASSGDERAKDSSGGEARR